MADRISLDLQQLLLKLDLLRSPSVRCRFDQKVHQWCRVNSGDLGGDLDVYGRRSGCRDSVARRNEAVPIKVWAREGRVLDAVRE